MGQFIILLILTLVFTGLATISGLRMTDAWNKWHKQSNTPKSSPEIDSTGFKISGSKNVLKRNISISHTTGFNINGERNVLEDNLSVGIAQDKQNISQIENILDQNLRNLKQITNKNSNFDIAILYDAAAKKYATFGLWEKTITYGYSAFTLYFKISAWRLPKTY